jgi:hypothetical protein
VPEPLLEGQPDSDRSTRPAWFHIAPHLASSRAMVASSRFCSIAPTPGRSTCQVTRNCVSHFDLPTMAHQRTLADMPITGVLPTGVTEYNMVETEIAAIFATRTALICPMDEPVV